MTNTINKDGLTFFLIGWFGDRTGNGASDVRMLTYGTHAECVQVAKALRVAGCDKGLQIASAFRTQAEMYVSGEFSSVLPMWQGDYYRGLSV